MQKSAALGKIERVDSQHVGMLVSGSIRVAESCEITRRKLVEMRLKQIAQLQVGDHAVVDVQYQLQPVALVGQFLLQHNPSS